MVVGGSGDIAIIASGFRSRSLSDLKKTLKFETFIVHLEMTWT